MTEKELDLIRQGKIPLSFGEDTLPIYIHEPLFERMRFLNAVCKGYMTLFWRVKLLEKWKEVKR